MTLLSRVSAGAVGRRGRGRRSSRRRLRRRGERSAGGTAGSCGGSCPSAGAGRRRVGEGGQRRVPELVQGQSGAADPPGMLLEQVLGAFVGQPSPPGDGADVDGGGGAGGCGAAIGEEQRAGLASSDDAGQQAGRAGLKMQPLGVTALGGGAARLLSRLTSSTLRERTSCARAAVSYSSRHRHFSRPGTSSRRNSRSSEVSAPRPTDSACGCWRSGFRRPPRPCSQQSPTAALPAASAWPQPVGSGTCRHPSRPKPPETSVPSSRRPPPRTAAKPGSAPVHGAALTSRLQSGGRGGGRRPDGV